MCVFEIKIVLDFQERKFEYYTTIVGKTRIYQKKYIMSHTKNTRKQLAIT